MRTVWFNDNVMGLYQQVGKMHTLKRLCQAIREIGWALLGQDTVVALFNEKSQSE